MKRTRDAHKDVAGEAPFKMCTLCGRIWKTREEFLMDEENRLNGYQYNRKKVMAGVPVCGLLLFTHTAATCGTTLALAASRFREGPASPQRRDHVH